MPRNERTPGKRERTRRVAGAMLVASVLVGSLLGLLPPVFAGSGEGGASTHPAPATATATRPEAPLDTALAHLRTAASPQQFPQGLLYYAPITVTNGQLIATESPFDLSIALSCANVASFAPADLQNLEFFDASGTVLPSWHESGVCSTQASHANYWVRLPSAIAAAASETIYVGFGPSGADLMNDRTTGAAPTCGDCAPAAPYGTYDDGASVFPYYQAWGSLSALPPGWTVAASGGDTLAFSFLSNATLLAGSTVGSATLENSTAALASLTQPFVWETYGSFDNSINAVVGDEGLLSTAWITESYGGPNNLGCGFSNGYQLNFGSDTGGAHLYALEVGDALSAAWSSEVYEDGSLAGCAVLAQAVAPPTTQGYSFTTSGGTASGPLTLQWTAIQTLPPLGVMPSVSIGAVVVVPTPYTVTFTESGLPAGTTWSMTFGGVASVSVSTTIDYAAGNGTYNFTVGRVAGYTNDPASGSLVIAGASAPVPIYYAAIPPSKFSVSFEEAGLPSGTTWIATLGAATLNSSGPLITFLVTNGSYSFSVPSASGYAAVPASGNLTVEGTAVTQGVLFNRSTATLDVSVNPAAAHVTVDGRTTGGSGGTYVWTVPGGSHYVNATLPGYTPYSNLVQVAAGATVVVSIVLSPVTVYGYLAGTVTPATATLVANGVDLPVENGSFNATVAPGEFFLSVSAPGYASNVTMGNVTAGETTELTLALEPAPGTVTVSGQIAPSNGSVVVNGIVAYVNATGQFHVAVVPGTYAVSFTAPGYFPEAESLAVSSNVWLDVILTTEPAATSTVASGNVTAIGYNASIADVIVGSGSISVRFTSTANGTLLVTTPYADLANVTLAQVLSSRVFLDGQRVTTFSVTLSSDYEVTLRVSELPADPTLFWALSPSASPPSPGRAPFLGLSTADWYGVAVVLGSAAVAASAFVAGRRTGGSGPKRPRGPAPDREPVPPSVPVAVDLVPTSQRGEDPLHDFF